MNVSGSHYFFFHVEGFSSTPLLRTRFHVRRHSAGLPLCCHPSHGDKVEYWWEGSSSTAVPPPSISDFVGWQCEIGGITSGAALICSGLNDALSHRRTAMTRRPRNEMEITSSSAVLPCSACGARPCTSLGITQAVLCVEEVTDQENHFRTAGIMVLSVYVDIATLPIFVSLLSNCIWDYSFPTSSIRFSLILFHVLFLSSNVWCFFAFQYCYSIWTKHMDKKYWSRMYCTSCLLCTLIFNAALFFVAFFVPSFTPILDLPIGLNIASFFFSFPYLLIFYIC